MCAGELLFCVHWNEGSLHVSCLRLALVVKDFDLTGVSALSGSFAEYLKAELNPGVSAQQASADLVRGQNERQRVCVAALCRPCFCTGV